MPVLNSLLLKDWMGNTLYYSKITGSKKALKAGIFLCYDCFRVFALSMRDGVLIYFYVVYPFCIQSLWMKISVTVSTGDLLHSGSLF